MQITETNAEGLKHEFMVVVPAGDIERQLTERLTSIGREARLPGFRPGKVPLSIARKRWGPHVMREVLEQVVSDGTTQAMRQHSLRPALQPKVEILSYAEGKDLAYKMAIEVLPEIRPMNFAELALERLEPTVSDEEIDKAVERMARQRRTADAVDRAAEKGDLVVIDFVGKVDGEPFEGGTGNAIPLELGEGTFVPGFEDQLMGVKAGDERTVAVTFPADYKAELAGKAGEFAVTVKEVKALKMPVIDDSLAEAIGMENLKELRDTIRDRIKREYAGLARQKLKRELLDRLAEHHHFPVPPGMVELELDTIWRQFEAERERAKQTGVALEEGKSDDEIKAEYRSIAERRVRLGLLLSEVGRSNNIQVTQDELNRALAQEARRHPGREREVIEFYRNTPNASDTLRAPLFEEKVVDFIVEMAKVTTRDVTGPEIMAIIEAQDEEPLPTAASPAEPA